MTINEIIVHNIKLLELSKENIIKVELEKSSEKYISEMKMYGKRAYIEIYDGINKNLIIATNANYIYNYFLELKILEVTIENGIMNIEIVKNYNSEIDNVYLTIKESKYKCEFSNDIISIDLNMIDHKNSELLFKKKIFLNVQFKNENFEEPIFTKLPIKRKIKPTKIKNNLLVKNDKFQNIIIISLYQEKVKLLEEFIEEKNKKFIEIILPQDKKIKKKENSKYQIVTYKKFQYMVYLNQKKISKKEALKCIKKKEKYNVKLGFKFTHPIIKILYKTVGDINFQKIRYSINDKRKKTGYEHYIENLGKKEVIKNTFLLEGFNGNKLSGSLVYIAKELGENPQNKVFISNKNIEKTKKLCERYNIKATYLKTSSKKYYTYLLAAEYIVIDTTTPRFYIKQNGQKLINSWHGTPLKAMGKKMIDNPLDLANTQRNFNITNQIIVSNEYTAKVLYEDYMMNIFNKNNIFLDASPRNSEFFEKEKINETKKIKIVWMPTWRGVGNKNNAIVKNINLFEEMNEFAKKLDDSYDFYASSHQLIAEHIMFGNYKMKEIPSGIDIYEFLNTADILITDYSSIMFDFAVKNKKIILDIHDLEEYQTDRGFDMDIEDLPFIKTRNSKELLNAIEDDSKIDYTIINEKFNKYDSLNGTKEFVNNFLSERNQPFEKEQAPKKEDVLIYPGTLLTNGITTSFLNLLSNLNTAKYNYVIFLPLYAVKMKNIENIKKTIAFNFDYIAAPAGLIKKKSERIAYHKFIKKMSLTAKDNKLLDQMFSREQKRLFGDKKFNHVIHFTGYDAYIAKLFLNMDAKKHIFVHNDMSNELKLRNNFNEQIILEYYEACSSINVVNGEVKSKLMETYFHEKLLNKVNVVHNTINFENILEKSKEAVDSENLKLIEILNDSQCKKFINIARFSPEKGLTRLLNAFNQICDNNPKQKFVLFFIGGHGSHTNVLDGLIKNSKYKENIFMFTNINPLPILKKSDLFVLSSFYEGLPMVFFESLVLGIPILSTDIPGPSEFLKQGYGNLCENSTEGLIAGMQSFIDGNLDVKIKSLVEFNNQAVQEFEKILK